MRAVSAVLGLLVTLAVVLYLAKVRQPAPELPRPALGGVQAPATATPQTPPTEQVRQQVEALMQQARPEPKESP
ncbi:MAG: hypothetical protein ACK40S_01015 [Burkholderiaceae bacterium]